MPFGDDQVGDLVVAGPRGDADDAGDVRPGVGDELLGAVDRPLAVVQRGARADVAGVRARLGLGQPERAEDLARRQARHPLLLLLLGPEQVDRLRAERRVRAQRDRHRRVHARELLDRDRVGQRVAAASAVLLRERDAHQPELPELLDDRVRERLRAVQLLRDRSHLPLGEVAHRAADQLVVVGEIEVHAILIPNARYKCHVKPPTSPALRENYDRRQQEVVTIAAALFARRGFQATSMDELSEATGPRSGGLYHYIGSKQQLLFEIFRQLMDPLLEQAARIEASDDAPGAAAARTGPRLGRAHRAPPRPHGRLRPGAPRDRARARVGTGPREPRRLRGDPRPPARRGRAHRPARATSPCSAWSTTPPRGSSPAGA